MAKCAVCNGQIEEGYAGERIRDRGRRICRKCVRSCGCVERNVPLKYMSAEQIRLLCAMNESEKDRFFENMGDLPIDKSVLKYRRVGWYVYMNDEVRLCRYYRNYDWFHERPVGEPIEWSYDDIAGCELVEEKGTEHRIVKQSALGRAAVGAMFFGAAGAVVGANTAKSNIESKEFTRAMYVRIRLKNSSLPIRVSYIEEGRSDFTWGASKTEWGAARELVNEIDKILAAREPEEQPPPAGEAASPADEIRKYKALLDDGIITEEEFTAKKRQLLGL